MQKLSIKNIIKYNKRNCKSNLKREKCLKQEIRTFPSNPRSKLPVKSIWIVNYLDFKRECENIFNIYFFNRCEPYRFPLHI